MTPLELEKAKLETLKKYDQKRTENSSKDDTGIFRKSLDSLLGATKLPGMNSQAVDYESLQNAGKGVSDNVYNSAQAAKTSIPKLANQFGGEFNVPEYNPRKTGTGTAYEVGNVGADFAKGLATDIGSWPVRVASSTAYGAASNPESPIKGGLEGLAWGAIPESAILAAKHAWPKLKESAEKVKGSPFAEELSKGIQESYKKNKDEAWGIVKPFFDKYGKTKLNKKFANDVSQLMDSGNQYITSDIKKARKTFMKEPSLDNLQHLQSEVGRETRALDLSQAKNQKAKEVRDTWRGAMIEALEGTMEHMQVGSSELYGKFRPEYRTKVAPYESGKNLQKLSQGKSYGVKPKKVYDEIMMGKQSGRIGDHKYFDEITPKLEEYLEELELFGEVPGSKLYSNLISNKKAQKAIEKTGRNAERGLRTGSALARGSLLSPEREE